MRDKVKTEYHGKGVKQAIANVNGPIAGALVGKDLEISNQEAMDKILLPVPVFNVINGGSHAGNKLAMQEFMLFPHGAANFTEAMKMGSETYHHLKSLTKKKFGQDATNVGD